LSVGLTLSVLVWIVVLVHHPTLRV
jgi:hypothetical protein